MKVMYALFFFFPFLVIDDSIFYGILVSLLGFLLVKFYTQIQDMAKDIKQLLINEARNSEKIEQLEEEVNSIKNHLDA